MTCPSELKLERHLLSPDPAVLSHAAACTRCTSRLAAMDAEGQRFAQYVYPATVDAVVAPRRAPWVRWIVAAAPLAGAAALLLLVRPDAPPPGYVGAKGDALALTPFVSDGRGAQPVADGATVPASASLRFRVQAGAPCSYWLLSIDAAGAVSRIYPPEGTSGAPVAGSHTAPGGARLDGAAGPERFFAVCGPASLGYDAIERSARSVAGRGADAVRKVTALPGLPEGVAQATVLVEKKP